MREVRVYDGDFPSLERMMAGDPTAVFPKEVWLSQVRPGEFAVRYKDFKTGLARNPAGEPVKSSEICRIFGSLEEARADSREVTKARLTVRCFLYDHTGKQVASISNNREVGRFALAMYAGILLGVAIFGAFGMGLLWLLSRAVLFLAGPQVYVRVFGLPGWLGWAAFAFAGLLVGGLAWYWRIQFAAGRRVDRVRARLKSMISPDERRRFEELNILHGTKDPAARERFLKLLAEYQEKVREAVKQSSPPKSGGSTPR